MVPEVLASTSAVASASTSVVPDSGLPHELADAPPFGDSSVRAACGKRPKCKLLREKSAGVDTSGMELTVASVAADAYDTYHSTERREHWVLGRRSGHIVHRAFVAWEAVVEGQAVDETVTISTNHLRISMRWWPTSTWQSYPTREYRLSPLQLLRFDDIPQHVGDLDVVGTDSLDFLAGKAFGRYRCATRSADFQPLPAYSRPFDGRKGLGACGMRVDGTPGHGYVLEGKPDPASGWLKAAHFGSTLVVEVFDDTWTADDALEIHTGRSAGFMGCMDEAPKAARQYIVHPDGRVDGPAGAPAMAATVDAPSGNTRIFAIQLTSEPGITLVHRDADGAGKPRRIGTSPLGKNAEIGDLVSVGGGGSREATACVATPDGPIVVPTFADPPAQ